MAVVTLFMSDRDESRTFTSKKEADAYDKMLELAEGISHFVGREIDGLSERQAEDIGILFARHAEVLAAAMKGKTDVLFEPLAQQEDSSEDKKAESSSHLSAVGE
ncbi:YebG family protein [Gynuella sunshinyii]|uniref:YebG protein n=1 Tax=Gynuella sunshinyii YC6258 TaxID=1445510 RepID=A0A0C5VPE3_9GAMM|nr:YebG family protein [Gynuella sunshinyii]AJQ92129.1 hypothetical protein YC6258_00073 [Gynuella sunshinyii YC6258]